MTTPSDRKTKWFVDEKAMDVVLVECVEGEMKDTRGNVIYGNTHFDDKASAWIEVGHLALCMYHSTRNRHADQVAYYLRGCEPLQKARNNFSKRLANADPHAEIHKAFYEKAARIIAEWNADGALGDRYAKAGDAMDALHALIQKTAGEIESFQQSAQLANDDEYFIVEIVGVDDEWHPLYNRFCGIATFATDAPPKVEALAAAKATGRVARVARFRKDVVFLTDEEPPSLQKLDRELFG